MPDILLMTEEVPAVDYILCGPFSPLHFPAAVTVL